MARGSSMGVRAPSFRRAPAPDAMSLGSRRPPVDNLIDLGAARPEPIRRVSFFLIPERDAAHHAALLRQVEVTSHERRMVRYGGLRDRGDSEALRREHEARHIGAAVDRTVDAEIAIRGNDRDMRRAEQTEILESVPPRPAAVAFGDAHAVVELPADLAAALQVD